MLAAVAAALVILIAAVAVITLPLGSGGPTAAGDPSTTPVRTSTAAPTGPELFGPAPADAASQPADTSLGTPRRSRYVSFEAANLPDTTDGTVVTLNFFDDAVFTAPIETIDRQPLLTSWTGPIDGLLHSTAVITFAGGRYQVTAATTRGTFTMSMTRAGFYQVEEVGSAPPADAGGTPVG